MKGNKNQCLSKITTSLWLLCVFLCLTSGCQDEIENPVSSVTLDQSNVTIVIGSSLQLIATIAPSNATNKELIWNSSNTSVATVNEGQIKALNIGTAIITVRSNDRNKTATCVITVVSEAIGITSISLDTPSLIIAEDSTLQLSATIEPSNATNKNIMWSSSDVYVAAVSSTGMITANNAGTATITATTEEGKKTAVCTVTVTRYAESITLNRTNTILVQNFTFQLSAIIAPSDAAYKEVTWKSSDESIATVNSTGLVTARNPGRATISVNTNDRGKKATCIITVVSSSVLPVTSKTFTVNGVTLDMIGVLGDVYKFNKTISMLFPDPNSPGVYNITTARIDTIVVINSFLINKFEVTQELWLAVMGNYPSTPPSSKSGLGKLFPVYNVSWDDIVGTSTSDVAYIIDGTTYYTNGFCSKLSSLVGDGKQFRLPNEMEWEYAAKGGRQTHNYIFSGSNSIDDVAWWYNVNSEIRKGHAVGTKNPNELGLYDMSGNICEWCSDNGFINSNEIKILRGGSWSHAAEDCTVLSRIGPSSYYRYQTFGFRIVCNSN
ncbi:MAG: Ig-like domain-containing protein [Paludibacter sp.]|nr:Ig-like domain-containing protein [Paludibacter sp.]